MYSRERQCNNDLMLKCVRKEIMIKSFYNTQE